jgi:hypothetical protein
LIWLFQSWGLVNICSGWRSSWSVPPN